MGRVKVGTSRPAADKDAQTPPVADVDPQTPVGPEAVGVKRPSRSTRLDAQLERVAVDTGPETVGVKRPSQSARLDAPFEPTAVDDESQCRGTETSAPAPFVPESDGSAGAAQARARAGSRPVTTEVPFGAHSFSADPKTRKSVDIAPGLEPKMIDEHSFSVDPLTRQFLDVAPKRGVPASVMPLLSEDLRPAENERSLLAEAKAVYAPAAVQKIAEALEVARAAHEGQTQSRKNDPDGLTHIPYLNHPVQIARMCIDLGMSAEAVQAALLHDVVEDTGVTLPDLSARFAPEVTALVAHLTKLPTETRAEYLSRVSALVGDASVIKILDRVHNLLRGFTTRDAAYLERYLNESQNIYAPKVAKTPSAAPIRARFDLMMKELANYAQALRAGD